MPLIRELIAIPERVHQGDCVLQLSKGVAEPEHTPRGYVVTPELDCLRGRTPGPRRHGAGGGGRAEAGFGIENPVAIGTRMKNLWTGTRSPCLSFPHRRVTKNRSQGGSL